MARYYFDFHDGKTVIDNIGRELGDFAAVRDETRRLTFRLASDMTLRRDAVQLQVNVRDGRGDRIYTGSLLFLIEAPQ